MKSKRKNTLNCKSVVFFIFIFILSLYLSYLYLYNKFVNHQSDIPLWYSEELLNISDDILNAFKDVKIKTKNIKVDVNGQKVTIFMRESISISKKPRLTALFLHGASSSSKIWVEIETMQLLTAMGLRVVAIDLPGWANSKDEHLKEDEKHPGILKARFIQNLIRELDLGQPIIISPSMSGSYSIPYMMLPEPETCHQRLLAFIPIAPVQTQLFTHAQYHRCQAPAMIVYGSNDTQLGLISLGNLRNMPNARISEMHNLGHACYINKPTDWNLLVYNFVRNIQKKLGHI